jgi:hypothetical protein
MELEDMLSKITDTERQVSYKVYDTHVKAKKKLTEIVITGDRGC